MIPLAPHNPKDHPSTPAEKLSLLILKKPYIQHIFYIEPHLAHKRSIGPCNGSFATRLAFPSESPKKIHQVL